MMKSIPTHHRFWSWCLPFGSWQWQRFPLRLEPSFYYYEVPKMAHLEYIQSSHTSVGGMPVLMYYGNTWLYCLCGMGVKQYEDHFGVKSVNVGCLVWEIWPWIQAQQHSGSRYQSAPSRSLQKFESMFLTLFDTFTPNFKRWLGGWTHPPWDLGQFGAPSTPKHTRLHPRPNWMGQNLVERFHIPQGP